MKTLENVKSTAIILHSLKFETIPFFVLQFCVTNQLKFWNFKVKSLHDAFHHIVDLCIDPQVSKMVDRCWLQIDDNQFATVHNSCLRENIRWLDEQAAAEAEAKVGGLALFGCNRQQIPIE